MTTLYKPVIGAGVSTECREHSTIGGDEMKKFLFVMLLALSVNAYAKPISIMAYNAENLFNTTFDQGTDDYTYLPLATKQKMPEQAAYCASMPEGQYKKDCLTVDWTPKLYKQKIMNLSEVITSFDQRGVGPDIIVMEEIENIEVLEDIVTIGLPGLGYEQVVLIEGDDSRGIDVGLISKFPVVSAKHHSVYLNRKKLNTRGILEVTLDVRGKLVTVFGNHWPSQNNPAEERVAHAKLLSRLAAATTSDFVVAVGDFNTVSTDDPQPFDVLDGFIDAEVKARAMGVPLNPGSHFFKDEWQSLDRIFVHENSVLTPIWSSFQFVVRPFMMGPDGGPMRFNKTTGRGYSDHLPVTVKVEIDNRYW